jgi:[ribosomal protein S5]-alanine N-acetyltransferase
MARLIAPNERFEGQRAYLRLVTLEDCTERYVDWLADPEVHRYLETRWEPQPIDAIRAFVTGMMESETNYLFAILPQDRDRSSGAAHVGNIKIGPIDKRHDCADVSYFLGDRTSWGRGLATSAVNLATKIGFERLGLHRIQAGVYSGNTASARVLEKCGYRLEGRLRSRLRSEDGWEDHLWYGIVREEWLGRRP